MPSALDTPESSAAALPVTARQELAAITHVLSIVGVQNKSCLDVGFSDPMASLALRGRGGYWCAVPRAGADPAAFADALGEEISPIGRDNELPFEDKQFDVAVASSGMITGDWDRDVETLRELHRVLRPTGFIVAVVPVRKPFGLANLFSRDAASGYADKQIFDLFKHGFDMLGSRSYCRFWSRLAESSGSRQVQSLAALLDCLVFARGYRIVAYGRRKVWRQRPTPVLRDGRSLSEAVLFPYG